MILERIITFVFFYIFGTFILVDSLINKNYEFLIYSAIIYYFYQAIIHQLVLHRYFSHRYFKLGKIGDFICYMLSVLSAAGTPRAYAIVHMLHHAYTDTIKDPHGPVKGYFTLFNIHVIESKISKQKYKSATWYSNFFNNYYYYILWAVILTLFFIDVKVFYFYVFTTFLQYICVDFFNYISHLKRFPLNYRNFDTEDKSYNNLLIGFLASDWHNNHHGNPKKHDYSHKWWEIDLLYLFFIRWIARG